MNNTFKQISDTIKKAKNIAIFTHINPDFDAFGSALALYFACKKMNKSVSFISKANLTEKQEVFIDKSWINEICNESDFDLFISTDTPSKNRLGDYGYLFESNNETIVIDHHQNVDLVGKYNFINTSFSSCSEIVFKIIKALKINIDQQIASLLYLGLSADTGSFMNTNTNSCSFKTAYELSKLGADLAFINQYQYRSFSIKEIEIRKYLYENYKILGECAYILVDLAALKKMACSKADCDFYSSELISIKEAKYSFSIIESNKNFYEISMRAKSGYNVRDIANELGGGGHIGAAGAKVEAESIEAVKDKILQLINKR